MKPPGDANCLSRETVHFWKVLKEPDASDLRITAGATRLTGLPAMAHQAQTPLITTTPYVYEAFLQVYKLDRREEWRQILESMVRHVTTDIKDFRTLEAASSCSYSPYDNGGVINAAAYRALMLTSASKVFANEDYWKMAERNLNFVLENQNTDGSWPYAVDGVRDFVDHFHTCFVMKALAKIHTLTGPQGLSRGAGEGRRLLPRKFICRDGLPRPFSKAPD